MNVKAKSFLLYGYYYLSAKEAAAALATAQTTFILIQKKYFGVFSRSFFISFDLILFYLAFVLFLVYVLFELNEREEKCVYKLRVSRILKLHIPSSEFQCKPDNNNYLHFEKYIDGLILVLIYCAENAQGQACEYHKKSVYARFRQHELW